MSFSHSFKERKEYFVSFHHSLKKAIEKISTGKFKKTTWQYKNGSLATGGGTSLLLGKNNVFEKAGLNFSAIKGEASPNLKEILPKNSSSFQATGVSLVFHPLSPMIPTIHLNVRYFESDNGVSWFGGGIDLTPYYPYPKDFEHFHQSLKKHLDEVSPSYYPKYKKNCDDYFWINHRQEMRGIGGVFFDYLPGQEKKNLQIVQAVSDSFLPSYAPIIQQRQKSAYKKIHRDFQLYRRGRYVEFNLLYDRGTKFGIKSGGRIDSILMSLPPVVTYPENFPIKKYSFSEKMTKLYQKKKWV